MKIQSLLQKKIRFNILKKKMENSREEWKGKGPGQEREIPKKEKGQNRNDFEQDGYKMSTSIFCTRFQEE